ncbi:TetR family transcriptional regulator [Thermanaerosceptrum fracticalcis]|uniref:TetR family transcriptional regulator n=1 Tax=Thermanaerosceptrum fracticalcis TaxID=1712410 RepID=A0A7G6E529_THEFR|nr:TetR/AcrR family transcriptional regulator [Thermanaerosceptrum fracticalcis]QNB47183.1 TetR family transcriptional regulator [Thermanaerosceptrum fracticalcis]
MELAIEEFAAKPYSKASLSSIVARAGIAKGSMYQYFENKKDLYTYILELAAQEKMIFIQSQGINPSTDFFTLFEQVLMAGARFTLTHPHLGRIMANAMEPSGEEVLNEVYARMKELFLDFIRGLLINAHEQGSVRKDINSELMAYLINAMMTGLSEYFLEKAGLILKGFLNDTQGMQKITEEEFQRIIKDVIRLLRNGLKGENAYD